MKTLTPKTYVWAHRGASGYAPENTLEAFELAAKMGADGIELDVHFTKDGEVVVTHDEKIDRVSNGQGPVTSYTYAELLNFDFGYKFYGEARGIKLPTLDEVYALLQNTPLVINIEIKSASPEMPARCIEIAKKYGMLDRTYFSSFNHFQLVKVREVDASVSIAPLYSFNMVRAWDYCGFLQANAVHPHFNQINLDKSYVENCHNNNIRVNVWTTNSESDISAMLDAGVDAVITNYPDVALKLRDGN
ncbi:MAG: glycerophosphodiester phosphodiesterase [Clostridia bacterium]|nr:glycerophosphodiester phosphodiesterase [Clostridia bacterium]